MYEVWTKEWLITGELKRIETEWKLHEKYKTKEEAERVKQEWAGQEVIWGRWVKIKEKK